jgi:hypothetical protein
MEQNNALLAMQYFKYSTCIEKDIIYPSSKVTIGQKKDRVIKILKNRNDGYDTLNKHGLCIKKPMEPQFNIYSNTVTTQKIESLSYCQLHSKLNILLQFLFLSKLILLPPSAKWYIADIWMSLFHFVAFSISPARV